MGVRGLSTFIKNRNHGKFLKDHQLHDTKLIIDGSNLIHFLYSYSGISNLFGGDYDNFANFCKDFFISLAKCKITPIVVFDGAADPSDRKFQTLLQRMDKQLQTADKGIGFILPLMSYATLFRVLDELNVAHIKCLFEADREIAVLANKWQCPVLSNDGDFYVYNLKGGFIPLDYMIGSVPVTCVPENRNEYFLPVKRYICQTFLKEEFKMENDECIFPVFAVLNGNDYFEVSNITLVSPDNPDDVLTCANHDPEDALRWICSANFETGERAFKQICEQIPDEMRQQFKDAVDSYKDITDFALFNLEAFLPVNQAVEEKAMSESIQLNDYNGNRLPSWVVEKFIKCQLSCLFIFDIAVNRRVMFRSQMELLKYPSSFSCSREIRHLIYRIVLGPVTEDEYEGLDKKSYVEEYDREKEPLVVKPMYIVQNVSTPSLYDILAMSEKEKVTILFGAFGATPESFDGKMDLVSQIFILASRQWLKNAKPDVTEVHLTALFIGIMALHAFELDQTQKEKSPNTKQVQVFFKDIQSAMCDTRLVKFLKIHLRKHFGKPQNFDSRLVDREIVHVFAQFQTCLLDTICLQQVLMVPVSTPSPSLILNCTFIYNFYRFMNQKNSAERSKYIEYLLGRDSALHSLFTDWKALVLGH